MEKLNKVNQDVNKKKTSLSQAVSVRDFIVISLVLLVFLILDGEPLLEFSNQMCYNLSNSSWSMTTIFFKLQNFDNTHLLIHFENI